MIVTGLLLLRLTKWVGVSLLVAGALGALLPERFEDRRRSALYFGGPGFALTWIAGFLMAFTLGVSLGSAWILGAIGLSLVALNAMLYVGMKDGRRGPVPAAIIVLSLLGCLVLMVWRPS